MPASRQEDLRNARTDSLQENPKSTGHPETANSGRAIAKAGGMWKRPVCNIALLSASSLFAIVLALNYSPIISQAAGTEYAFNDSHFHLTNYIQEGLSIRQLLSLMGTTTGRSTLFGIPLQQQW